MFFGFYQQESSSASSLISLQAGTPGQHCSTFAVIIIKYLLDNPSKTNSQVF
jgi:hypothetical protein